MIFIVLCVLIVLPPWLYYVAKYVSMGCHVGKSRGQNFLERLNKYNE